MLEMFVLLLVAAVFLPDLVFGGLLALLWLAEKLVLGAFQVISMLLAIWSWGAARTGNAWFRRHHPRHHPHAAP